MDAQVRSFKQGQVSEDEARALLAKINHDHNARYTPEGLARDPGQALMERVAAGIPLRTPD
jgi:hypothetical protein